MAEVKKVSQGEKDRDRELALRAARKDAAKNATNVIVHGPAR